MTVTFLQVDGIDSVCSVLLFSYEIDGIELNI